MITGIAHACFVVRNLDAALDFYQRQLGLTHAFDFKNEQGVRTGVYLLLGRRTFIELFQGTHADASDAPSYKHICLEVDDIQATVKTLRKNAVQVSDPILGKDQSFPSMDDRSGRQPDRTPSVHRYQLAGALARQALSVIRTRGK